MQVIRTKVADIMKKIIVIAKINIILKNYSLSGIIW